jgi:hypothetical protein
MRRDLLWRRGKLDDEHRQLILPLLLEHVHDP